MLAAISATSPVIVPYESQSTTPAPRAPTYAHEMSPVERVRYERTICGAQQLVVRTPAARPIIVVSSGTAPLISSPREYISIE